MRCFRLSCVRAVLGTLLFVLLVPLSFAPKLWAQASALPKGGATASTSGTGATVISGDDARLGVTRDPPVEADAPRSNAPSTVVDAPQQGESLRVFPASETTPAGNRLRRAALVVHFDPALFAQLSPEDQALALALKARFEDTLAYHAEFTPVLPPSRAALVPDVSAQDLFRTPYDDEMTALAFDTNGERRRLSAKHLAEIRAEGQCRVASRRAPGRDHVGKISPFVHEGAASRREDWRRSLGAAAGQMDAIPVRFQDIGSFTWAAANSVRGGASLLVGLPEYVPAHSPGDVVARIRAARQQYVWHGRKGPLAEAIKSSSTKDQVAERQHFLRRQSELGDAIAFWTTPKLTFLEMKRFVENV